MNAENLILAGIGISFLGFLTGLVARNTNNSKKKSLRREDFFKYLSAVSVILLLILAVLYNVLYL